MGSKTTFGDGRGTFNIAAFYMDISDLQATVTAGSCSSRVVFNVPKALSQGLEFELAYQPNPPFRFRDLRQLHRLRAAARPSTSTDSAGNVSVVSGIENGNRLPTVPKLQIAAAANYRWEINERLGSATSPAPTSTSARASPRSATRPTASAPSTSTPSAPTPSAARSPAASSPSTPSCPPTTSSTCGSARSAANTTSPSSSTT